MVLFVTSQRTKTEKKFGRNFVYYKLFPSVLTLTTKQSCMGLCLFYFM